MAKGFEEAGFLSAQITAEVHRIRADCSDWFALAEDVNAALMRAVMKAMGTVKTASMKPKAVAVRIAIRACGAFQGTILLTERGMMAEGRILARSLVEDAFSIAAVHAQPEVFMHLLKADSQASRRNQAKFIIAEKLVTTAGTEQKLQAVIDEIGKKDRIMNVKELAAMGALLNQYLAYQRLSDDAAHTSAKALNHHIATDAARKHWQYRFGPGDSGETAATLQHALLATMGIGVALTHMLGDAAGNAEFLPLADRFAAMPPVPPV